MTTTEKLNKLYELKSQLQLRKMDMEALIQSVIPDEVKQQIKDIQEEFAFQNREVEEEIIDLGAEILDETVSAGMTLRGDYLMSVYSKPRVTWNTKELEGYAVAHPEVNQFRKVGEASASIRAVN